MEKEVKQILSLSRQMERHYHHGNGWKNIPLAKEVFELVKALPDNLATSEDKGECLSRMFDVVCDTDLPRFAIAVREYIADCCPNDETNAKGLKKLRDYINPSIPMEEWCKVHGRHLLFDPVERTEEWERVIYEVEKTVTGRLRWYRRGMGFCFRYWSVKQEVLAQHGISWQSPKSMNPRVMFD